MGEGEQNEYVPTVGIVEVGRTVGAKETVIQFEKEKTINGVD